MLFFSYFQAIAQGLGNAGKIIDYEIHSKSCRIFEIALRAGDDPNDHDCRKKPGKVGLTFLFEYLIMRKRERLTDRDRKREVIKV